MMAMVLMASGATPSAGPSASARACPSPPAVAPTDPGAPASPTTDQPDLTVFAAASLGDAFEDLALPWADVHPGSDLVLSLDASSTLRVQVEQGAPADVFAAADAADARAISDACLAGSPVTPFAGNTLVVVVPAGNPAGVVSPADLARPGLRFVAAGPDVPISGYAAMVLDQLSRLDGYPAAFADAVAANVVSEEDNVRAVLAKIELGEGDAAIVYATDAARAPGVEIVPLPAQANIVATYAAVTVWGSADPALASDFLAFLTGPVGQGVLRARGFLPVP
jgi:molybdate transport system substrate-binding protein